MTAKARVTGRHERKLSGETTVYEEAGEPVLAFAGRFIVARNARIRDVSFDAGRK